MVLRDCAEGYPQDTFFALITNGITRMASGGSAA
jgi:hypothetical protein